ncbi:methyl-accepting chemotaxis protein [Desulfovirgula thermocuniculi]|uniref:methyl-accepting chemotaxis protein n=1 Tax=Desulfovirgula thermocuniculi TaxID=348842 RepID=UPI00146FAF66|nr:methyl-accepting chemotaxis protein [Desulfovirgula thermocuniculi]
MILSFTAMLALGYWQVKSIIMREERKRLSSVQNLVETHLTETYRGLRLGIESVASNPAVQEALAARDREKLRALTEPVWLQVKREGVEQFQFHLPPATAFLRLHMPEKYGDDLSSFRATVVEANREKKLTCGLEEGRGGFGFRAVAPVFYQGQHVGSVEYGLGFNSELLARWKEQVGGEFFVYRRGERGISWVDRKDLLAATQEEDSYPVDEKLLEACLEKGQAQFAYIKGGQLAVQLIPLKDFTGATVGYVKAVVSRQQVLADMRSAVTKIAVLFFLAALFSTAVLYVIMQRFLHPLSNLLKEMARVGEGDLTVSPHCSSKDEVGRLTESFCKMLESIRSLINQVASAAVALSASSKKLSAHMGQISSGTRQATGVAGALAQIAEGLSQGTHELKEAAHHASQGAVEGEEAVANLIAQVEKINTLIGRLSRVVHGLGQRSQDIGRFVEVITEIARQTNLLSLNASIEAARAGEQGKGFAVVANEVRKLAEESARAAAEIGAFIREIREETDLAIKEMENSISGIGEGLRLAEKSGSRFKNIVRHIQDLVNQVERIAETTSEINAASQEVAATVEEQSAAMEQVTRVAEELAKLALTLEERINRFKLH